MFASDYGQAPQGKGREYETPPARHGAGSQSGHPPQPCPGRPGAAVFGSPTHAPSVAPGELHPRLFGLSAV